MADELISAYKDAYLRANQKPFAGSIHYQSGWIVFQSGGFTSRYRRKKLIEMTETLNKRAEGRPQ